MPICYKMINNMGYESGRYKMDSKSPSTRRNIREHTVSSSEKVCGYFLSISHNKRKDTGGLKQPSSSSDNNSISLPSEYTRDSNVSLITTRPIEVSVSQTVTQPSLKKLVSVKIESISHYKRARVSLNLCPLYSL